MIKVDDKKTVIEGYGLDVMNDFCNVVTSVYRSMVEDIGGEDAGHIIKDLVDMSIRRAEQKESENKGEVELGFDPNSLASKLLAAVLLRGMSHDTD